MTRKITKKPHEHLIPVFFAALLGVSLSYFLIAVYTHGSSAGALSLLKYISSNRSVTPATYPLCPQLKNVSITVDGVPTPMLLDKCTNLYWPKNDAPGPGANQLTYTWDDANGFGTGSAACLSPYRMPTPDEMLSLASVPCGEIRLCAREGRPVSCTLNGNECGDDECRIQACSPILRPSSGFFQYTAVPLELIGDGSYWSYGEQNLVPGNVCSLRESISCTGDALCDGSCNTQTNKCSNDVTVPCGAADASQTCDFGICQVTQETGISVSLKYGTVNNPALGKNIQLPVRCIYDVPDNPLTEGLVGRWEFETFDVLKTPDTSGVTPPNDGTLSAAHTPTKEPGNTGFALSFYHGNDSSVTVPNSRSLEIANYPSINENHPFTISALFMPLPIDNAITMTVDPTILLSRYSNNVGGYRSFIPLTGTDAGKIVLQYCGTGNCPAVAGPASPNFVANTWYNYAGVFDGIKMRIYINGVKVSESAVVTTLLQPYDVGLTIGTGFKGLIDEVLLYSRALNATEVSLLYDLKNQPDGIIKRPADVTKPIVTSFTPAAGAMNIPVNTTVRAIFDEPMEPSTIQGAFTLKQGAAFISGVVTYTGSEAKFTPTNPLAYNLPYTATMTVAATDLAENPLFEQKVWSFTTAVAPTVTVTTPSGAVVAIGSNITATFSETMDPLTLPDGTTKTNFTILPDVAGAFSTTGNILTFNPTLDLANSTLYTVTLTTGVKGLTNNALATNEVWSFTTEAVVAPAPAPAPVMGSPLQPLVAGCAWTGYSADYYSTIEEDCSDIWWDGDERPSHGYFYNSNCGGNSMITGFVCQTGYCFEYTYGHSGQCVAQ